MASVRPEGRKTTEMRPLSIMYERLDRVDGSARFGFGDDKALASLSGPIEVRLAAENPSKATLEILLRPFSNVPDTSSKSLAGTLRALLAPSIHLKRHPRTLVQIVVQMCRAPVRERMGGPALVAACVNAASGALLDAASVPMRGVVCAVGIARLASGALVVDPEEEEAVSASSAGCFAFLFTSTETGALVAKPVWTNWRANGGAFDEGELGEAREMARVGAEEVWRAMRESVRGSGGVPLKGVVQSVLVPAAEATMETSDDDDDEDDTKMEI